MRIPKFSEKELEVVGETPPLFGMPGLPFFNYPCSMKEAVKATFRRDPYWLIFGINMRMMTPAVIPDNIARAFVFEANPVPPVTDGLVPDMFGIEWEYVPAVGGSMVRPGKPFAEDAWELLEKVQWPNPDEWDWKGSAKANNGTYLKSDAYNIISFLNGWFERLISMLDFENALMALYDEDQKEAVHKFFDRLTDLYITIFGRMIDAYPDIDGFSIHDDWGSQKETFFSPELCAEMIVPYMRRVTDFLHSRGKTAELHSCGQNIKQVPNMIAAGWDAWFPQNIVDSQLVYEMYGDKILVGVDPGISAEGKTEDEMRKAARDFVDRFMQPGKPCFYHYNLSACTPAFCEELYSYSRKKCCDMAHRPSAMVT
ncbi:MAG TPA: methyltransferase [Papillibacter sp.]|nr:methyltransferase [Papillibacter sp.]